MSTVTVNGTGLHVVEAGAGSLVVLVHGGWTDHTAWAVPAERLAERHRVVSYDRRGASRSERPSDPAAYARREHEDDLAALIEALGDEPAYLVGSSYGGLVSLGLLGRRPELVRAVALHEPACILAAREENEELIAATMATFAKVVAEIEAGDHEGATRRFFEELALGPGAWDLLPREYKEMVVNNAPSFAREMADPDWSALETKALDRLGDRILLTRGDASPRWLQAVTDDLAAAIPSAATAVIPGAGHAPHLTHAAEYVELVEGFFGGREQAALAA